MSYDRELTVEATRAGNRLHNLLLSSCPTLETHLRGKRIQSQFYLNVLARYSRCAGLKKAGGGITLRGQAAPMRASTSTYRLSVGASEPGGMTNEIIGTAAHGQTGFVGHQRRTILFPCVRCSHCRNTGKP